MIRIERMHLTNWHDFLTTEPDSPIMWSQVTYITGNNYSGKTTLIDAVQAALFVKKSGYNRAQTVDGGTKRAFNRTLIGYMRAFGKGDPNNIQNYTRKGDVVTNIVIECRDTDKRTTFLVGASFASTGRKWKEISEEKWWFCDNSVLEDCPMTSILSDGRIVPLLLRDAKKTWEESVAKRVDDSWDSQYRAKYRLSQILGITSNGSGSDPVADFTRWVTTMEACIGFNPSTIKNPDQFVRNVVLEEDRLQPEMFKNMLDEYQATSKELARLEKKEKDIHAVVAKADEHAQRARALAATNDALVLLNQKFAEQQHEKALDRCDEAEAEVQAATSRVNFVKDQIAAKKSEYQRLQQGQSALAVCHDRIEKLTQEIKTAVDNRTELQACIRKCADISTQVNSVYGTPVISLAFPESFSADNITEETSGELRNWVSSINGIKGDVFARRANVNLEDKAVGERLTEVNAALVDVAAGKAVIQNKYITYARDAIAEEFRRRDIASQPHLLYESLNYKNGYEEWHSAAEALLGGNLLAILVLPQYYTIAAEVCKRLAYENDNFYGAFVVDTRRFTEKAKELHQDSIAHIFESSDPYDIAFIEAIVGNTIRVPDATNPPIQKEAKNLNFIDRNRFLYRGFGFRRLAKPKQLIVGAEARERELNRLYDEKQRLSEEKRTSGKRLADFDLLCKNLDDSSIGTLASSGNKMVLSCAALPELRAQLSKEEAHREELSNSEDARQMDAIAREIAAAEKEKSVLDDRLQTAKQLREKALGEEKTASENISKYEDEVAEIEADPSRKTIADQTLQDWKEREKRVQSLETLSKRIDAFISEEKVSLIELRAAIVNLQNEYNRYNEDYMGNTGLDAVPEYREELQRISKAAIPQAKKQADELNESLSVKFWSYYIDQLASRFRGARDRMIQLNKVMKRLPFGGYIFQFRMPAAADGEAAPYFEAIQRWTSAADDGMQISLEHLIGDGVYMDEKSLSEDDAIRRNLFENLRSDDGGFKNGIDWMDYRSYLSFGIEAIEVRDDGTLGQRVELEQWSGNSSGAEMQVPFYIILGATLLNIYSKNSSRISDGMFNTGALRLLIVDECFSKCDRDNTQALVDFLSKKLNLQLVCVAPNSKYGDMAPCIDSVIFCVSNNKVRSRKFYSMLQPDFDKKVRAGIVDVDDDDGDEDDE